MILRSHARRVLRRLLFVIVAGSCYIFYKSLTTMPIATNEVEVLSNPPTTTRRVIYRGCLCRDKMGIEYDFCYQLDENGETSGKRFNCSLLNATKRLGLLDQSGFVDLTSDAAMPNPVFVTGVSSNHFSEEKRLIYLIQSLYPHQKIVLYDLGLMAVHVEEVKSFCNLEYRKFRFEDYPQLCPDSTPLSLETSDYCHDYSIKFIEKGLNEALKEFSVIWWLDSSVVFKKPDLSHVYALVQCQNNISGAMKSIPRLQRRKGDQIPAKQEVESGWNKASWRASLERCDKFPYLLHGYTGHGIFPATSEAVYSFFPADMNLLKRDKAMMFEAGFAFAVRTQEVVERVLKWYVLCALEEFCMAPRGATLGCRFGPDRFATYASCHRFDQSVVNLLLANANRYDRYYWTSEIVDFFNIVRGAEIRNPQKCSNNTNV